MVSLILLILLLSRCSELQAWSLTGVKPGCSYECGNLTVPYPFGIGPGCYLNVGFEIVCNYTFDPPKPFLGEGNLPVLQILPDQVRINNSGGLAYDCQNGFKWKNWIQLGSTNPYTISGRSNKFLAMGCDTKAFITDEKTFTSGCISQCNSWPSLLNTLGVGYCETSIPEGLKYLGYNVSSFNNYRETSNYSNCSYSFLVEDGFQFSESKLRSFYSDVDIPMMVDWAIGNTTNCSNAEKPTFCGENTRCIESTRGWGYLCNCSEGYEGNPYLNGPSGCQDIDECKNNPCTLPAACMNLVATYQCYCPTGYKNLFNDTIKETICISDRTNRFPVIQVVVGVGLGILFLLMLVSYLYWAIKKREFMQLKEEFFKQNGGVLLQQKMSSSRDDVSTRIFTIEELKKATNNYDESQILGTGGYGTVYKGTLANGTIVAIKKSKIADASQIEQFINEVFVLSQINHRNVVKLLGCCLEAQVPLLVYEFISNGTVFHHLHEKGSGAWISWGNRLRIAIEIAEALAYLHSSASMPIIHRDVKSANILLDDEFNAKVADFGASRLVPLDQNEIPTLVQGTLGYLDPEYFQTGQLTAKSDVYSFGVVLVELLTCQKPISAERSQGSTNLAMHFISSMKENRLRQVLEVRVLEEGTIEQVQEVANLAVKCLRLKGEKRPTMKEVAQELGWIKGIGFHPWVQENHEESELLLGERPPGHTMGWEKIV